MNGLRFSKSKSIRYKKNELEATALPSFSLERAWKNTQNAFFSMMKNVEVMKFLMGGIKRVIFYI